MSFGASSVLAPTQRGTFASLLAGRVGKRPRQHTEQELQQAAVQLLNRNQNLSDLLLEVGSSPKLCKVNCPRNSALNDAPEQSSILEIGASLLGNELKRQAEELGVPVAVLSVKVVSERVVELTGQVEGDRERVLLTSTQRAQLSALLQSTRELLSLGAFSPKLFWQEYWRTQPLLEVVHHLHSQNILSLEYLLESEDGVSSWLGSELQALCGFRTTEEEERDVQQQILSTVVSVLVRAGFEESLDSGTSCRRSSQACCSALDSMLSWLLDTLNNKPAPQSEEAAAETWVGVLDTSLFAASVSGGALRRFYSHSLTQILTHRPRLKVSDAIAMQNEWSFAKTCPLLTSLFRKLCVLFSMEELLSHLQQVLETHEVNWQHVLSCLSTLLVYHSHTQPCLKALLSRLLSSAFEGYDPENMVTAFLLARQGALEGPAVFSSYSEWFKTSFGGAHSYHGNSKKSMVFLLKFLSDLVPFDPPQYLKVHILYPPYVAVKQRPLLQEYVTLAKTRLADLKVSIEDMGLYEDVSKAGAAVQPQCQARQDVEKALSLFESTGRISATVMEASIFRRPYFLSRFLPALLTPRELPVKTDARMTFIESLRKAGKIPAGLHSSYTEACQREAQRQRDSVCVSMETDADLQVRLQAQLQELRRLLSAAGSDGDVSAQLARISNALGGVFPERPDQLIGQTAIKLDLDKPSSELHANVINLILRSFCQSLLDASRVNPPNRQGPWATQFVNVLLGHRQLLTALLPRLWDLLHNQGVSLSAAHVLGLAVLVVELHVSRAQCPLVQLSPSPSPSPVAVSEALSTALPCTTRSHMAFCLRFCVAAVCYGLCRGGTLSEEFQLYVPSWLYKKLLYLIPRLIPAARTEPTGVSGQRACVGEEEPGVWESVTDPSVTVRRSALGLWTHAPFHSLQTRPDYQLSFSEWLTAELRVQRSQDTLSDPERQEYEQWACLQQYLPSPLEHGGCAGDTRRACTLIINTLLDQHTGAHTLQGSQHRQPQTDTCLPDVLSRLQEMVCELEMTRRFHGTGSEDGHFLLDLIASRCSVTPDSQSMSSELGLQQTLHTWNRVMLSLPAAVLVPVWVEGGRRVLDCQALMEHVNQQQRKVCCPAGLLPYHLTAHFLRGVLSASVRCDSPAGAVNRTMAQISLQCPLLLLSAGHWWVRLSPVLGSQWSRLTGGESLPEQLQLLDDCLSWASRSVRGMVGTAPPAPPAPPLVLAAFLHRAWEGQEAAQSIRTSLGQLGQLPEQHQPLLVLLLFVSVTDLLSAFLRPQGAKCVKRAQELCTDILSLLVDSADWLLLFHQSGSEQSQYQSVTMVTTDEHIRLMPLAFYSLVPHLDAGVLSRAVRAPGFLFTAVLCYSALLKLFLDGQTPRPSTEDSPHQMDVSQILSKAQQLVLKSICLSPQSCLTHSQRSQLEAACGDLDPEVAAALSMQLKPSNLSPAFSQDLDFL